MKRNWKIKNLLAAGVFAVMVSSAYGAAHAASNEVSTTQVIYTMANTPANLTQETDKLTSSTIVLDWEANGNPVNTAYTLEISTDNSSWSVVQDKGIDDLQETLNNLTPSTKYYVRVSSYNQETPAITNGEYLTGSFTTKPAAATTPTPTIDGNNVTIPLTNEPGITNKVLVNGHEVTVPDGAAELVVPNLEYNAQHAITIIKVGAEGLESDPTTLTIWTDANVPANPRLLDQSQSSIKVAIDSNGNAAGSEYQFVLMDQDENVVDTSNWSTDLEHEFANIGSGQYKWKAQARNSAANPTRPNQVTAATTTMPVVTVPATPTLNIAEVKETSMTITLTPAQVAADLELRIVVKDEDTVVYDSGWAKLGRYHEIEETATGLSPNKKYSIEGYARYAD